MNTVDERLKHLYDTLLKDSVISESECEFSYNVATGCIDHYTDPIKKHYECSADIYIKELNSISNIYDEISREMEYEN